MDNTYYYLKINYTIKYIYIYFILNPDITINTSLHNKFVSK